MSPLPEDGRSGLIVGTLKSVAVIAALSFLAANWLSSASLDQGGLSRLASNASRGAEDPLTTGSIGRLAAGAKLDPCAAPRRP